MMELVDVTKVYLQGRRSVQAVRGVSMTVVGGEFVSIMGPSGSGKSTLMHLMGALDTPSGGKALFHGQDLNTMSDRERSLLRRTRLGFVFQFFNLLPTLRADENVALPLLLGGWTRANALKQAIASMERVGIAHRADHFPEAMSGGEMQRVAIARALVTDPEAVLCDEPTGNLDSKRSREILSLLSDICHDRNIPGLLVTHDPQAVEYVDHAYTLSDGKLQEGVSPELALP